MNRSNLSLIGPKTIGDRNRASLITILYDRGPLSRADLARILQTTRSTITAIVQPLINQKILSEVPLENQVSNGTQSTGKPGTPLWFAEDGPTLIGIHIVPRQIVFAQLRIDGTILNTQKINLPQNKSSRQKLEVILGKEIKRQTINLENVLGVGVSVGGMVNSLSGRIINVARAPYLNDLEVKLILEKSLGKNVVVDHHPRAQALGERWFGEGRNKTNFVTFYISDAIGVGMYLNGTLHSGPFGSGGEYGHTFFPNEHKTELCNCGLRGCLELSTNFDTFLKNVKRSYPLFKNRDLPDLVKIAQSNKALSKVTNEYAEIIAIAIANLEKLLAPGFYIIHGDATRLGEDFNLMLNEKVSRYILKTTRNDVEIEFAGIGDNFSVLGAASLVLARSLHFPV